jgi:hypothetical protein
MLGWNLLFHRVARIFKILFGLDLKRVACILLKSTFATGDWSNPQVCSSLDEVQQHLLMVTAQTQHAIGIGFRYLHHVFDTTGRIVTAID